MSNHGDSTYDAVIVGAGITGGWAAKQLTEAGMSVLLLDAGPMRRPEEVPPRSYEPPILETRTQEPRGNTDGTQFHRLPAAAPQAPRQQVQSKHGAFVSRGPHLFVDDVDCPYVTPTDKPFTWIRSRQVGGRSLVWGGTSLRFSRYEFEASRREGIGTPWPFSYDELAPCYETVERFMGLTGEPAGLSQLPDSVFTFAPPPLTRSEKDLQAWTSSYARDCAAVPVRWIDSDARYAGWPRLSTPGSTLASAYQTGRLEVRANAVAREVVIDRRAGRATGVQYVGAVDGKECTVRGRVVLLCAGTIESTRLLLLSGVGERSDALGRFLMDHPVVSLNGTLLRDGIEPGHGFSARQRGLLIPRFQNLGDRAEGFRGGFGVWASFQRGSVDGRGLALLAAQGEMVPSGENVVSLSDEVDRWGIPVPRIECSYTDNDAAMRRAQLAFLGDICDAFAIATDRGKWNHSLPGGNVHELGTARLGADPETSALDPNNAVWGIPNLLVTDGACFPSGGWQNPTLTMMAITVRACANLVERTKRLELPS